jgi:hypothetical protein
VDTRTDRFPLGDSSPAVEIRNHAGSVTVEAVEAADEFVVEITPLDGLAEPLVDRADVVVTGSRLRVTLPERRLLRSPAFAVRVTVPPGTAVRVTVGSADVELRGRLGRAELTAASGDATVEHCADLNFRSASGDARIGNVLGRATLGSASGDVRVGSVGRGMEARTASGDVAIGRSSGDVSVKTASGGIGIDRVGDGSVRLATASGDVSVGVVPGLRVWLDLSSVSGRLDSQLDDDADDAGGPAQLTLSVRTVSGDQRIRRGAA